MELETLGLTCSPLELLHIRNVLAPEDRPGTRAGTGEQSGGQLPARLLGWTLWTQGSSTFSAGVSDATGLLFVSFRPQLKF